MRGDPVIVDGALIPTSDWAQPADLFSGKRYRAGMNAQVAVTTGGRLLALGTPAHGARHDGHAWRESGLTDRFPGSQLIGDLGYVGVTGFTTGRRRSPGGQLTDRERSANPSFNSVRAVVERTIAHSKIWKVLKHYRGPLDRFDRIL